ncbi:hypothetical protein [Brevibacterium sp. Mu109]|uniref:hypothetical protein n=1 Tax=Brevibacterium sp. Mu109 TaxID=1255669 RepID=UPI0021537DD0|nr:hypothetical protein [Brevibacterium sp. Mu109]
MSQCRLDVGAVAGQGMQIPDRDSSLPVGAGLQGSADARPAPAHQGVGGEVAVADIRSDAQA